MSKKISGAEYPLSKIFSSDFDYLIPAYQRPYAWTVDEAGELFEDLYNFYQSEHEDGYFLGSIVLIKEEDKPRSEVIDGQQRLTTLTILLSALTSQLSGGLRIDFESYIREPGRPSQGLEPKPRLSLRERDREFFARYVQGLKFGELLGLDPTTLKTESQKHIQSNSKLLRQKLMDSFGGNVENLCAFGSFIVQRCYLVAVSTPSQRSAFRVFSVLNNRGLDLQPTDIVKADVIGQIEDARRDEFTERWEDMEAQNGRSGFNDLFGHIRMIYAKEKARQTLLEEFRSYVLSKHSSSTDLIENVLEPYADAFSVLKTCQYKSTSNAQEMNALLGWLNRIDNSDWLPPAIKFLAAQKNDSEYVLWFFKRLERLAAYLHLSAKNVNERIERYAVLIKALESPHSRSSPPEEVELTADETQEFVQALDGNIYEMTARRRNYLILRLDSFLSDGAAIYDPALLTIEHVLPQTVSEGSGWAGWWPDEQERKSWVHRLANLVPLTQKRNSSAQNYDFGKKKEAYFGGRKGVSSYALTSQVLSAEVWTPKSIVRRQEDLLQTLKEKWRLTTS